MHGCDVVAVIVAVAGRVVVAMWLQLGEVVVGVAENEGCRERVRVMEQHGLEK